ncbi:MAG: hypothetical protein ACE5GN_01270 [Waddliaceae bacterium]
MKRRFLTFLLIINSAQAQAQEEILLTRQAESYFQAGEYDSSIELFKKLEEEKLLPWQHSRVIYNIGTNLLGQGSWNEALAKYSAVPYSPQKTPLLSKALKINTAIIQYREASNLMKNENLSLIEYRKAFYLYRKALHNIREAEKINCILQSHMGKEYCQPTDDVTDLHSAVKRELAVVTKKFGDAKIAESPAKEGIPFLLSKVKLALSHIDFLESKKLNDKRKKRYLKFYTRDVESWLSLWDMQMEQVAELEKARSLFIDGIRQLKQNRLSESRIAFVEAAAGLAKLMQELWGIGHLLESLQRLLTSYQRTLDQVPLQTATLYRLQIEQTQMREIVKTGDVSVQELNLSDEYLARSLEYARHAKGKHARFFLEEAQQWIRRLLRQQTLPDEKPPDEILENSIQEQVHALTLNHLEHEMSEEKEEAEEILRKSQQITLQTAEPFLKAVLAKEIREFPVRCQRKPWDKVIPLFDKGLLTAEQSNEILSAQKPAGLASSLQEKTIEYWKEALEKMRKPEEEEEEKEPEPPSEEPPPLQPKEETSMQEVLHLLQKMEQEDRQPRPQEMIPQQGLRPW